MALGNDWSRLKVEAEQCQVDLLRTQLRTCFTFATIADTESLIGDRFMAKRALAYAERGYAAVHRFVFDPNHAERISPEFCQELTDALRRLRQILDERIGRV